MDEEEGRKWYDVHIVVYGKDRGGVLGYLKKTIRWGFGGGGRKDDQGTRGFSLLINFTQNQSFKNYFWYKL